MGGEGLGVLTSLEHKVRLFSTWFISVPFQGYISKEGFVNADDFTPFELEVCSPCICDIIEV